MNFKETDIESLFSIIIHETPVLVFIKFYGATIAHQWHLIPVQTRLKFNCIRPEDTDQKLRSMLELSLGSEGKNVFS